MCTMCETQVLPTALPLVTRTKGNEARTHETGGANASGIDTENGGAHSSSDDSVLGTSSSCDSWSCASSETPRSTKQWLKQTILKVVAAAADAGVHLSVQQVKECLEPKSRSKLIKIALNPTWAVFSLIDKFIQGEPSGFASAVKETTDTEGYIAALQTITPDDITQEMIEEEPAIKIATSGFDCPRAHHCDSGKHTPNEVPSSINEAFMCVARSVSRSEISRVPAANEAVQKEWIRLE